MPQIIINQNEYLAHDGVKNMKWGVRRWQNPDGTLTPAGKVHYAEMYGWGKNAQDAGNVANKGNEAGKSAISTPNKIYKDHKLDKIKNNYREEAKHMSDDELRKITKRLELENKYVNTISPEKVESGADKALKALEIVGAVATTAIAVGKVAEMVSSHYIDKDDAIRKARGE